MNINELKREVVYSPKHMPYVKYRKDKFGKLQYLFRYENRWYDSTKSRTELVGWDFEECEGKII